MINETNICRTDKNFKNLQRNKRNTGISLSLLKIFKIERESEIISWFLFDKLNKHLQERQERGEEKFALEEEKASRQTSKAG